MAKIIQSQQRIVASPWWEKGNIVFIGLGLGLLWWGITSLLKSFVVEPLACRDLSTATACIDAFGVSGSIAAIVAGVIGVLVLIRALQPRPIVIALGTAVLLWDLGSLVNGLAWWEIGLWSVFFYTVGYVLFWLAARISGTALSLVTAAVVVIVIRLLLIL